MHALRMGKSVQKSGYKIGVTTIGLAASRLVEMLEKDDSDNEVASNIAEFKAAIAGRWKFEDEVLAFDALKAPAPEPAPAAPSEVAPEAAPPPEPSPPTVTATTVEPEAAVFTPIAKPVGVEPTPFPEGSLAEKKAAFLLYSTVSNSDLVYTERFERDGKPGLKIEAPGIMVLEMVMEGDDLKIEPANFGDSEGAAKIKSDYESWLGRI